MKKIIFILLCVSMFIPTVYAAPKRNTRSLDTIKINEANKSYKPGERIFLDFKMVIDTSNVDDVLLFFRSVNYSNYFLADLQDISGNPYLVIPKNIESNYYIIDRLTINYKDGNSTLYSRTGIEPSSTKYDFGSDYISIGNVETGLKQTVKEAKFSDESIISGSSETLSITLDSEIDSDETNSFAIITDGVNIKKINLKSNKTSTLTGNVIVTGTETTYYLDSITITDKKNNKKTIFYKNEILNKIAICEDSNAECLEDTVSFKLENNTTEEDTPILGSVEFSKKSTTDNVKIFVEATDNGSGINSASVTLYKISDDGIVDLDSKIITNLYYDNFLEEYVGNINFKNKPFGKYYIFKIELTDNLNSIKQVCLNECDTETLVNLSTNKYGTIELVEDTNEVLSINDVDLIEKIKESKDGVTTIIDISNNGIIQKEVFSAIQNTSKILVFKDKGIEWIFNGNDIEKLKEIDLSFRSSLYNNKELENGFVALELSDKGSLPGKAKVRINSLYTYQYEKASDKVNVFYVNGDKYDEIVNIISVTEDGYYEFEISQTGTYVMSDQRIPESLINKENDKDDDINKDNNKQKTKNKDNNLTPIILIAIPLVCLLVVVTVYCIKTAQMRKNSLENYVVDDPIVATPLEEEEDDEE